MESNALAKIVLYSWRILNDLHSDFKMKHHSFENNIGQILQVLQPQQNGQTESKTSK